MTYLKAFLLGLVQGVAEFLPISSSGHLAIARNLLNMEGAGDIPEFFDVLLHLGTLIAVFIAYWSDIRDMVVEFFRGIRDLAHRTTPTPVPPARRMILLVIVGTLHPPVVPLHRQFLLPWRFQKRQAWPPWGHSGSDLPIGFGVQDNREKA